MTDNKENLTFDEFVNSVIAVLQDNPGLALVVAYYVAQKQLKERLNGSRRITVVCCNCGQVVEFDYNGGAHYTCPACESTGIIFVNEVR